MGVEGEHDNLEAAKEAFKRAQAILREVGLDDARSMIDRARAVMAELERAERLAGGAHGRSPAGYGAKGRILAYFRARGVDVPVSGHELRRISGIQEWARRVRELRVEEGWDIRYDGEVYRLKSGQPDKDVAEAWRLAHTIREEPVSAKDRILQYLQARVGQVVNSELLQYVADTHDHDGRIRELRTELGYAISTYIDRPDLKQDEYLLESAEPTLDVAERQVSETLRKTVFERNGYRCVVCGDEYSPGVLLTAHHLAPKVEGGSDTDPENFVTLCHRDHSTITDEQQQELLKRRRRRIGGAESDVE